MAVDFAALLNKLKNADSESSGDTNTSGSTDTSNAALGDSRPKADAQSGFNQDEVRARILPEERDKEVSTNTVEPSQAELNERKARDQGHALGLNSEQTANLALAASSAGSNVDQVIQTNLPKITGIDPAILAAASEAINAMKGAGISGLQNFTLATGNDFGAQSVGTAVQENSPVRTA